MTNYHTNIFICKEKCVYLSLLYVRNDIKMLNYS